MQEASFPLPAQLNVLIPQGPSAAAHSIPSAKDLTNLGSPSMWTTLTSRLNQHFHIVSHCAYLVFDQLYRNHQHRLQLSNFKYTIWWGLKNWNIHGPHHRNCDAERFHSHRTLPVALCSQSPAPPRATANHRAVPCHCGSTVSRFQVKGIIPWVLFLGLVSITLVFRPRCLEYLEFIPFNCQVAFRCMNKLQFVYLFISWRTLGLSPFLSL